MLRVCGKLVERTRVILRKNSVLFSTYSRQLATRYYKQRAQPVVFTNTFPTFPLQLSPLKIAVSPLSEYYLYPVSTAPINNSTK